MEEKKQRRNKRILIISAMLVLLIALLCFGGTTFAKYITSKNAPVQQATVAKWGFTVTVNGDDMFSKQYNKGAAVKVDAPTDSTVDVNAASGNDNKLVAPGTSGSMTITIKGQAEVNAKIVIAEKLKDGSTDVKTPRKDVALKNGESIIYAPVKWTITKKVDGGTAENLITGDDAATKTSLSDCLDALIDNANIAAGTDVDYVYELKWTWAFENQNDYFDTALGYVKSGEGNVSAKADVKEVGDVFVSGTTVTVWDEVSSTAVDYTAETEIAFELIVSVEQTQNS